MKEAVNPDALEDFAAFSTMYVTTYIPDTLLSRERGKKMCCAI